MRLIYVIPFLLFIGIAIFLSRGLSLKPSEVQSPLIGKPMPAFDLLDLNHAPKHMTQSIFKGHLSVLNVWASWCATCLVEHAYIKEFATDPHVTFYGLNYKDNKEKAVAWLTKLGNPYAHIAFDPQGLVGMDLGVYGTPEAFLIDDKGIIRYKYVGMIDDVIWQQEFLPRINKLVH